NDRLQQYSRRLGRPITPEQARVLGLDRLVIGQLISEVVLDERARALGLTLSDAEVAKQITNDPAFRGPNGQFDRLRFQQTTRAAPTKPPARPATPRRASWPNSAGSCCVGNWQAPSPGD